MFHHFKGKATVLPRGLSIESVRLLGLFHALNLWFHLSAVVLWIGAMAFFLFVFAPAVHTLSPAAAIQALDRGRRSVESLSWIAINLLALTGLGNLAVRGLESGFPSRGPYNWLLAIKIALFLAMLFHHCLQVFRYSPQIASLTARARHGSESWPDPLLAAWRKWFSLLKINAALGPVILLLGLALASL